MEQKKEQFEYTYSAKQQEEVKKIRQKYIPKEENKMEQLRRLDKSATDKGIIWSLTVGIIGVLIFGSGMSLVMVWQNFIVGIPLGLVGVVFATYTYPLYNRIVKKQREKIAPKIIELTDELIK